MYQLHTGNSVESYGSIEAIFEAILTLSKDPSMNHQFILVEFEDHGYIEVALGMGSNSLLFYTPESPEAEAMITCNENIIKAKSSEIEIKDIEGEISLFSNDNVVPLSEALKVLNAFLKGEDFLHLLDWYTY